MIRLVRALALCALSSAAWGKAMHDGVGREVSAPARVVSPVRENVAPSIPALPVLPELREAAGYGPGNAPIEAVQAIEGEGQRAATVLGQAENIAGETASIDRDAVAGSEELKRRFDGGSSSGGDGVDDSRPIQVVHAEHEDGQLQFARRRGHDSRTPPVDIPEDMKPSLPSAMAGALSRWTGRIANHIHTIFSDGTKTPEEAVDAVYADGGRVVVITDHDTVAGIERVQARAAEINRQHPGDPISIIAGIEMSASGGAHIAGLGIDIRNKTLLALLARVSAARLKRAEVIAEHLNALPELRQKGITITIEEIRAASQFDNGGTIELPHIARVLLDKGLIQHVDDAFEKYLKGSVVSGEGIPADPSAKEVIEAIHAAGGKAILNHPYTVRGSVKSDDDRVVEAAKRDAVLSILRMADGVEAYRPYVIHEGREEKDWFWADQHVAVNLLYARQIEKESGRKLLIASGADYHGEDTHLNVLRTAMPVDFAVSFLEGLGVDAMRASALATPMQAPGRPSAPSRAGLAAFVPIGGAIGTAAAWAGVGLLRGLAHLSSLAWFAIAIAAVALLVAALSFKPFRR